MTADQGRSLQPELAALLETFRPYMKRASNDGHLLAYVLGLLADLKRKSIFGAISYQDSVRYGSGRFLSDGSSGFTRIEERRNHSR
ncbi:MAG: hypothetical protein FLDDKLPJ_01764 [Phycisphaerae bacterium]|nr:hypothetical protein [Phycisphaerae bacterium]